MLEVVAHSRAKVWSFGVWGVGVKGLEEFRVIFHAGSGSRFQGPNPAKLFHVDVCYRKGTRMWSGTASVAVVLFSARVLV